MVPMQKVKGSTKCCDQYLSNSSGVRVGCSWATAQGAGYKGAPQVIKASF